MPFAIGQSLGNYQIAGPLGKGGMGEVYRAKDTKLGREVAIKVLPAAFALHPERLARFEREARVLASLSHPNIAAIYAVEESPEGKALVMELVEGDTLKGPVDLDTALKYATQIASALEAAHEKGVTHRDLKPANIMLTPAGTIKVLDFGLAAVTQLSADGEHASDMVTLTMSPTQAGMILGTAGYMPPEQARGKPVDKRADIWSFGVVLHELLTGKRLFQGEDVAQTLAAVLMQEPSYAGIPVQVQRVLKSCLEKDPSKRLRDIGDVWRLLDEGGPGSPAQPGSLPVKTGKPWIWVGVAAAMGLIAAAVSFIHFRETPPARELTRFDLTAPAGAAYTNFISLSPDGRKVAFTARTGNEPVRLWVRSLDTLEAKALTTTGTNPFPFWSPDSRFIGYQIDGKLKKIDIAGGPPVTLCDASNEFRGGDWSVDENGVGTIVFGFSNGALQRVSDQGGEAVETTKLDTERQETSHAMPSFLPDGRNFLYLRRSSNTEKSAIYLGSLDFKPGDLKTGDEQASRRLLASEAGAEYAASPDGSNIGHVLFLRESTLFSQPFDEGKLALAGEAVPVAESVANNGLHGLFRTSANGALIYRTGAAQGGNLRLTWYDRQGKALGTLGDPATYNDTIRLSPDGTRVAATRDAGPNADIWLVEVDRGVASRFTFDAAADLRPVWSRDGRRIAFRSNRGGQYDLYQKVASGAGEDELLFKSDLEKFPSSWSRDGRFLLFATQDAKTLTDQWVLPVSESKEEKKAVPFVNAAYNEGFGVFSPDMKWIAYQTQATGRAEIYVRPFSAPGTGAAAEGQWQVSKDGGQFPQWSADGKEIFFLGPANSLMTAALTTAGGFRAATPQLLFNKPPGPNGGWDVTADGKKFLISTAATTDAGAAPATITVVLNWQAMLKK